MNPTFKFDEGIYYKLIHSNTGLLTINIFVIDSRDVCTTITSSEEDLEKDEDLDKDDQEI